MTLRFASVALLVTLPLLGACASSDPVDRGDGTETNDLAAGSSITAHVPGMTVWVEPAAVADWRYEQWVWVLRGRTSKNLAAAFSYSSDDEFGETLVTSKRKFELVLDGNSMVHLLGGHQVHIQLDTTTGAQTRYYASIQLAPRFARFEGTSKIFVHQDIAPVVTGGTVLFRGQTTTAKGLSGLTAAGPIAQPERVVGTGHDYRVEWTWPNLLVAADPPAAPIEFASGSVAKRAGVDFAVDGLTLSTTAPNIDPECAEGVRTCLEGLPDAAGDTSACGAAGAVQPCMPYLGAVSPNPTRFADDLALYLGSWYPDHGQDVASSGGAPMLAAQAAIHASSAKEVTDPESDPHAHDLSEFVVFSHPDMVWPGSDIVWFGAYDRTTGALQSIYDFN